MSNDFIQPLGGFERPKPVTWPWLAIAIFAAALIVAVWAMRPHDFRGTGAGDTATFTWGYVVTTIGLEALAISVALWVILFIAVLRRANPGKSATYFLILLVSTALIATPLTLLNLLASYGSLSHERVEQINQAESRTFKADSAAFNAEIDAIALQPALAPERLTTPNGLETARSKIRQERAVVGKYQALEGARLAATRAKYSAMSLPPVLKAQLLRRFDEGYVRTRSLRDRQWGIQDDALSEEETLVDVLTQSRGAWTIRNRKLEFLDPSDMNRFNGSVQDLKLLRAEQVDVQRQLDDFARQQAGPVSGGTTP